MQSEQSITDIDTRDNLFNFVLICTFRRPHLYSDGRKYGKQMQLILQTVDLKPRVADVSSRDDNYASTNKVPDLKAVIHANRMSLVVSSSLLT